MDWLADVWSGFLQVYFTFNPADWLAVNVRLLFALGAAAVGIGMWWLNRAVVPAVARIATDPDGDILLVTITNRAKDPVAVGEPYLNLGRNRGVLPLTNPVRSSRFEAWLHNGESAEHVVGLAAIVAQLRTECLRPIKAYPEAAVASHPKSGKPIFLR